MTAKRAVDGISLSSPNNSSRMIRLPIDPSQPVSVTLYANSNVAQVSRTLSVSLQVRALPLPLLRDRFL